MREHDGGIDCESIVGQGTRFILSFPPVQAERPCVRRRTVSEVRCHGRNGSILVVDDEEIMREILEALLTREGYHVRLASSGEEGLELARVVPLRCRRSST